MPIRRPSKDDYLYPSDAGIMGEDYRLDQLRFKEAPKTGGEQMSDSGIGDLSTDEMYDAIKQGIVSALNFDEYGFSVHEAIKQGVLDAFAGLLVNSHRDDPRADLLLSVERGVQEAFRSMMDATGSHPFTRTDILASIQEGTRQAAVERSKPFMDDTPEPEGAPE